MNKKQTPKHIMSVYTCCSCNRDLWESIEKFTINGNCHIHVIDITSTLPMGFPIDLDYHLPHLRPSCQVWSQSILKPWNRCGTDKQMTNPNYSMIWVTEILFIHCSNYMTLGLIFRPRRELQKKEKSEKREVAKGRNQQSIVFFS